jgi:nucleotide-binding universal stress UspA family protein
MRILLPIDDSPYSQEALRLLLTQFQKRGTQVRVLHVVEPVTAYFTAGMVPELVETTVSIERQRRNQAKTLLAQVVAKLRRAGWQASEALDLGDTKTVILDHADKWNANLILLGSHGLKGLGRFLMGRVSDAVIRHADCSVLVVRPRRAAKSARRRKR